MEDGKNERKIKMRRGRSRIRWRKSENKTINEGGVDDKKTRGCFCILYCSQNHHSTKRDYNMKG